MVDTFDGEVAVKGYVHDIVQGALVASVEPSVVFSSLAALCVRELCDDCTIDIIDGPHSRYRIAHPPRPAAGAGPPRVTEPADVAGTDHRVRVPFSHPAYSGPNQDGHQDADPGEFHGVATFVWRRRTPSRLECTMAAALTDHAVNTVMWQRSEAAAGAATAKTEHLQLALQTSRHIGAAVGILMSLYKITESQAFDMLQLESQRGDRKLRDLARDVIDTGWLDPALVTGTDRLNAAEEHGSA